jgi:hypothetical protein
MIRVDPVLGVLADDGSPTGPLAGRDSSVGPIAASGLRFRSSFTRVTPDPGDADERPFRGGRLGSNSGPPSNDNGALPCSGTGLRADVLRYSFNGRN